jgi:hypothetical protein
LQPKHFNSIILNICFLVSGASLLVTCLIF